MGRRPLLHHNVGGLPGERDIKDEWVRSAFLQLVLEHAHAMEESCVRHQHGVGGCPIHLWNAFVFARAKRGGHEGQGTLVLVDHECDFSHAAFPLPFRVQVRPQVDGPPEMHWLPAPILPFLLGDFAAQVLSVQDASDCELRDNGNGCAERQPLLLATVEDGDGLRQGELAVHAVRHACSAVGPLREGARKGMSTLESVTLVDGCTREG